MLRKSPLGWLLLSGASLAAIAGSAQAQDGGAVSDEIVVTATGREAALQDVPIAVTALGNETLEQAGVLDLTDLRRLAPSLRIGTGQSQSSGTGISIRGIGTGSDNPGFESAVGVFIDGVYRARTGSALADLPDIQRIEVLRGPQGTLYGKNTSSGAISVVTAAPEFDTHAWMEATGGDFNALSTRFGVNIPVVDDVFALRFDAGLRSRDGFIDDVTSGGTINDRNRWTARLQGLWDISPDASLRIILDASESDEACCGAVTLFDSSASALLPFSTAVNNVQPGSILTPDPEARRMSLTPGRDYRDQVEDWGISGQLDWDLGFANLTSVTAYRDWESIRNQDIDFSRMDRSYRAGLEVGAEAFSQEIRLQGEAGRIDWLVGGFYSDEQIDQTDRIRYGAQAAAYVDQLASLATGGLTVFGAPVAAASLYGFGFTQLAGALVTEGLDDCDGVLDPGEIPGLCAALQAGAASAGQLAGPTDGGLWEDLAASDLMDGDGQQDDIWQLNTESYALFTHDEISFTDSLVLTVGARWNHEEKTVRANLNASIPACDAIQANAASAAAALVTFPTLVPSMSAPTQAAVGPLLQLMGAGLLLSCNPAVNDVQDGLYGDVVEDDAASGTLSLRYHINDDLMVYAGYSRGYKSGGYNIDRSGFNVLPFSVTMPSVDELQFDPETMDAYEVGLRSTILGGTTDLNLTGFYQQIHDYQLNAFNGFNFVTNNVPEVISRGVELEVTSRPTDNLTFTGGVTWQEVFYDSSASFGTETITAGTPLSFSPDWTVTGSVNYNQPISDSLAINFFLNGSWVSDYRLQTLGRNPRTDQEGFAQFDARVGLGDQDGTWGIDVFVRNLTDEYYSVGAFGVTEQSLAGEGLFVAFPGEPRTFGVTLRARY